MPIVAFVVNFWAVIMIVNKASPSISLPKINLIAWIYHIPIDLACVHGQFCSCLLFSHRFLLLSIWNALNNPNLELCEVFNRFIFIANSNNNKICTGFTDFRINGCKQLFMLMMHNPMIQFRIADQCVFSHKIRNISTIQMVINSDVIGFFNRLPFSTHFLSPTLCKFNFNNVQVNWYFGWWC